MKWNDGDLAEKKKTHDEMGLHRWSQQREGLAKDEFVGGDSGKRVDRDVMCCRCEGWGFLGLLLTMIFDAVVICRA